MAKELQIRRGTTQANDLFIGEEGELSMDTTTKGLRVHDGQTVGGFKIDTVVDFQVPTSSNNYTWYRKYSSGWVEQGGISATGSGTSGTITLPITMQDNNYTAIAGNGNNAANNFFTIARSESTTTAIKWYKSSDALYGYWLVNGMAA